MDRDRKLFDMAFERLHKQHNPPPKIPQELSPLSLPQWTALLWPHACTVRWPTFGQC